MSEAAIGSARYVGTSVKRVEDARHLTGRARYVGDVSLPSMLHAAFLRSPYPHAVIGEIDARAAKALPGVLAVFTGADLAAQGVHPMQGPQVPDYERPVFPILATDRVRTVGDPIAIVVAESRYVAEDALALIEVDYDLLDPITTPSEALADGAPLIFEDIGTNVIHHDDVEFGDVDGAFAEADLVVRGTFSQQRLTHAPMETRGGVADYDAGRGELTYHASTHAPGLLRLFISGQLGHPSQRMRVLTPGDVGGSFGQKIACCREDVAVCAASRALRRPVKWIEDRAENLTIGGQAREETLDAAFAVRRDGTILGIDVTMTMDHGAYPAIPIPSAMISAPIKVNLPSSLRVHNYRWSHRTVATNKASYLAYRGPWAAETWVREAMIARIARQLELPVEDVYRRNVLAPHEQPATLVTGPTLEGVTTREALDRALEIVDLGAYRVEQELLRESGRFVGVGISMFIEAAPGPPNYGQFAGLGDRRDPALVRLEPDGRVTLATPQVPHGQGHETTLAQIVADEVGIAFEDVRVVHSDTSLTPFSLVGTSGSRAATMAGGSTLHGARALKSLIFDLAGDVLEVAAADLELVGGVVRPKGVPGKGLPLAEIGKLSYLAPRAGMEGGLEGRAAFATPRGGWVSAVHLCFVEVDVETGVVTIPRYLVVEDCGKMINPAIVEGQIRGGVAQGIGMALLEESVYDPDGYPLTTTFMDYVMPTAVEIPHIEIVHLESESLDEVGYRGVGEGGMIGAPAAVANAISDALAPFGATVDRLPLRPSRILELLDEAAR